MVLQASIFSTMFELHLLIIFLFLFDVFLIGWIYDAQKLSYEIIKNMEIKLSALFNIMLRIVIPFVCILVTIGYIFPTINLGWQLLAAIVCIVIYIIKGSILNNKFNKRKIIIMFFKKENNQNELKKSAAIEAAKQITSEITLGVGTGSTVAFLIEELVNYKDLIKQVVSSSEDSTKKLKALGFDVVDLNYAGEIDLYIDGADECNNHKELIKGGGAALTREKICVAAAKKFVCIIDESKLVKYTWLIPSTCRSNPYG